jgi:pyridoxal phosphate enzyme (YggS family)
MQSADPTLEKAYSGVLESLNRAAAGAARPAPRLVAVSKTRTAAEVAALHALGQRAFGENYVQEAAVKMDALAGLGLEWHLIGHLQSNKAREAAVRFDWIQTVDRARLAAALAAARPAERPPLNVLIQVNVDDEASKSGCRPDQVDALADAIAAQPRLRLRGLMAIPTPSEDMAVRRAAFAAMRRLFEALARHGAGIDTLSMGMSDDAELAIAEGATLVRIGTRLFGPRAK